MRRLAQEIITDQQSEDERLRILTFLHGIRDGDESARRTQEFLPVTLGGIIRFGLDDSRRPKMHKGFPEFTLCYTRQVAVRTLNLAISKRALAGACVLLAAAPLYAQAGGSPWENAVQVLQTAFTSTIARGLSLVAIVVGGLIFAFGEGQSKRTLAGIIFGVGMSIGAVNFMAWLFP